MAKAFFRSEKMELCHLLMHVENAFDVMVALGHNGMLQFNNIYDEDRLLNNNYTKQVALCQELLRMVQYLGDQCEQVGIEVIFYPEVDEEFRVQESDIPHYERRLRELHSEALAVMEHYFVLEKRKYHLMEWRFAILAADKFLRMDGPRSSQLLYTDSTMALLLRDQSLNVTTESQQLNYIVGSINFHQFNSFELLLYRLFGRNLIVRRAELPAAIMEVSGTKLVVVRKFALLLLTNSATLRPRILKVCAVYHVAIFECPAAPDVRKLKIEDLQRDIDDANLVLDETQLMRRRVLGQVAADLYIWRVNLRKARRIYDVLNRLSVVGGLEHHKYLQAQCFVPASHIDEVRQELHNSIKQRELGEGGGGLSFPPILLKRDPKYKQTAPTYFRLNKFTRGFQNLIDAYGIADYRELNPAPYTIITFPFLFAIMFGDIGHGIIMTLFGAFLIWKEKSIERRRRRAKSENEILNILFAGRYIILLMGFFSIYMGFIYNEILAKSINIFGSSWSATYNESTLANMRSDITFNSASDKFYTGHPYPIGMDPIWKVCGVESITTFNSLKMKMAIILGITQMMFGLSLAALNCVLSDRIPDLILVVIPQFIFMTSLFGYLVFLIFFKWLTYGGLKPKPQTSDCAPSVLITFIDMMLLSDTSKPPQGCERRMFPGERIIEYLLVVIAFAAVPVLLAGRPIYLTMRQRKLQKAHAAERDRDMADLKARGRDTIREMRSSLRYNLDDYQNSEFPSTSRTKLNTVENAIEFDMSEIWIHSGIHTIESVLGSVSHTASYLRLWALSLAHDQLSHVLWIMVLTRGLNLPPYIPVFLSWPILIFFFYIWAVLTVAILVMMEGLSAFLHTLRLHWVEFQSKFFEGAGEKFMPFHFHPSSIRD